MDPNEKDEAVAPLIAVILIIMLSLVLTAILGSFFLGWDLMGKTEYVAVRGEVSDISGDAGTARFIALTCLGGDTVTLYPGTGMNPAAIDVDGPGGWMRANAAPLNDTVWHDARTLYLYLDGDELLVTDNASLLDPSLAMPTGLYTVSLVDLSEDMLIYQEEFNLTNAPPVPHTSKLTLPNGFYYGESGEKYKYKKLSDFGAAYAYWEVATSYDPSAQQLFSPFTLEYTVTGDSSFTATLQPYSLYYQPGSTTYYFDYAVVDGSIQKSPSFTVGDNTSTKVTALYYTANPDTFYIAIAKPVSNSTVPFSSKVPVEVHATGAGLNKNTVYFAGPDGKKQRLAYNDAGAYFTGSWDSTAYAGQTVTLTAWADRTSSLPTIKTSIQVTVSKAP